MNKRICFIFFLTIIIINSETTSPEGRITNYIKNISPGAEANIIFPLGSWAKPISQGALFQVNLTTPQLKKTYPKFIRNISFTKSFSFAQFNGKETKSLEYSYLSSSLIANIPLMKLHSFQLFTHVGGGIFRSKLISLNSSESTTDHGIKLGSSLDIPLSTNINLSAVMFLQHIFAVKGGSNFLLFGIGISKRN